MSGASTTFATARFLLPNYLVREQVNLITCPLWSAGALVAPSAGMVTVYNESREIVASPVVNIIGGIATATVAASSLPTTRVYAQGWSVEWSLTVGGVETIYRNKAALVRSDLHPVITDADLYRRIPALDPNGTAPITSADTYQHMLDEAWLQLLGRLEGRGNMPALIIEPTALREVHILLTLALIYESFVTQINESYQDMALLYHDRADKEYNRLVFDYDAGMDGDSKQQRVGSPVMVLSGRW